MRIEHRVEKAFFDIRIEVDFLPSGTAEAARNLMAEARRVALVIDPEWEDFK